MFYFFNFLYTIYVQRVYSYVTCNDEMTGLLNEGRTMDIAYLEFKKAFDTLSCEILTEKLMKYGLDEQRVKWTENWLNGWAQRMVISGMKSSWRPISFLNECRMGILRFLKECRILVTFTESNLLSQTLGNTQPKNGYSERNAVES